MAENLTKCQRCAKPAIGKKSEHPDARPFKRALKGMCTECVVAAFFQDDGENGVGFALPDGFDPAGLRLPHLQEQFARVLSVGMSELPYEIIDWDEVIANWPLPFPKYVQTRQQPRDKGPKGLFDDA